MFKMTTDNEHDHEYDVMRADSFKAWESISTRVTIN